MLIGRKYRIFLEKIKSVLSKYPTVKIALKNVQWFLHTLAKETFNVICWCIDVFLPLVLLSYLFYLTFAGTLNKVSSRVSDFYRVELR